MITPPNALQLALEHFKQRREKNKNVKIDNSSLPAGAPMYYYCRYCKAFTEVLPESHLIQPKTICDPCKALTAQGIDLRQVGA